MSAPCWVVEVCWYIAGRRRAETWGCRRLVLGSWRGLGLMTGSGHDASHGMWNRCSGEGNRVRLVELPRCHQECHRGRLAAGHLAAERLAVGRLVAGRGRLVVGHGRLVAGHGRLVAGRLAVGRLAAGRLAAGRMPVRVPLCRRRLRIGAGGPADKIGDAVDVTSGCATAKRQTSGRLIRERERRHGVKRTLKVFVGGRLWMPIWLVVDEMPLIKRGTGGGY